MKFILAVLFLASLQCKAQPKLRFQLVKGTFEYKAKDSIVFVYVVAGQYHYTARFAGDECKDLRLSVAEVLFDYCCEEVTVGTQNLYFTRQGKKGKNLYIGISTLLGNFCTKIKERDLLIFDEFLNANK